jgi:hypothetical protein
MRVTYGASVKGEGLTQTAGCDVALVSPSASVQRRPTRAGAAPELSGEPVLMWPVPGLIMESTRC